MSCYYPSHYAVAMAHGIYAYVILIAKNAAVPLNKYATWC